MKESIEKKIERYEAIEAFNQKQIETIDSDMLITSEKQLKDLGIDPFVDIEPKGGNK